MKHDVTNVTCCLKLVFFLYIVWHISISWLTVSSKISTSKYFIRIPNQMLLMHDVRQSLGATYHDLWSYPEAVCHPTWCSGAQSIAEHNRSWKIGFISIRNYDNREPHLSKIVAGSVQSAYAKVCDRKLIR